MAEIVDIRQLEESLSGPKEKSGAALFGSNDEVKAAVEGLPSSQKDSPNPVAAACPVKATAEISSPSSSFSSFSSGPPIFFIDHSPTGCALSAISAGAASPLCATASSQSGLGGRTPFVGNDITDTKERKRRAATPPSSSSSVGQKLLQVRAAARFMQGRRPQQEDRHVLLHDAATIVDGSERVAFQALQCDPMKPLPKSKSKQLAAAAAGSVSEEAPKSAGTLSTTTSLGTSNQTAVSSSTSTPSSSSSSTPSSCPPQTSPSSLPSPAPPPSSQCAENADVGDGASGGTRPLLVRLPVAPPGPVPAFPGMSRELQQLFPSIGARLASAFRHTDRDFLNKYRSMKVGGCTAVLLIVLGPVALLASVGDSRAVAGVQMRTTTKRNNSKRRCLNSTSPSAALTSLYEENANNEPFVVAPNTTSAADATGIKAATSTSANPERAAAAAPVECSNNNGLAGEKDPEATAYESLKRDSNKAGETLQAATDTRHTESGRTQLKVLKRTASTGTNRDNIAAIGSVAGTQTTIDAATGASGKTTSDMDTSRDAGCSVADMSGEHAAGTAAKQATAIEQATTAGGELTDAALLRGEVSTSVEMQTLHKAGGKDEEEDREEQEWRAVRVTRDHKPDDPEEQERIEKNGGLVLRVGGVARVAPKDYESPDTSSCALLACCSVPSVSRGMGDRELKEERLLTATPDVSALSLNGEVKMLVVACDGVWDVLSDEEVIKIASQHLHDPQEAASQVVKRAFQLGSQDNLTSIVVLFDYEEER